MTKKLSAEHKKRLSEARKGIVFSREHLKKLSEAKLGAKNNRYGVKLSEEIKKRIGDAQRGDKSKKWKGDNAKKMAMHQWIERIMGKPKKCEHCGTTAAKKYEWANKNHTYLRDIGDYVRLCTSCHRKYDYQFNHRKNQYGVAKKYNENSN